MSFRPHPLGFIGDVIHALPEVGTAPSGSVARSLQSSAEARPKLATVGFMYAGIPSERVLAKSDYTLGRNLVTLGGVVLLVPAAMGRLLDNSFILKRRVIAREAI